MNALIEGAPFPYDGVAKITFRLSYGRLGLYNKSAIQGRLLIAE
jgi:hypothetical protein